MKYKNIANCALASCVIFPCITHAAEQKWESTFSTLNVADNAQKEDGNAGSDAETYSKPGAFSSRKMNKNLQSLDATLRTMPGTFTQQDALQGAVNVNIRGMSGFGRVNTMVDGVSQTYYGMAPSSYHGGANSASGVLIDQNFLAGVDISRGNSAGSQGVNALAGSANMRTIGIDDIVRKNRQTGVLTRFTVGDNGFGRSGMIAVAGRSEVFGDGGSIGGLAGFSDNVQYATYKNGAGIKSDEFLGNDNSFMKQKPNSQLYKLNINPDRYTKFEFGGRNYHNNFTQRNITSDDYYLKYDYTPLSELIDVKMLLSTSRSSQTYNPGSLSSTNHASTTNKSEAVDLSNTSRFSLGDYDFSWQLGGKVMDTKYTRAFDNSETNQSNGFAPSGKQNIAALYTGLTINKDIYQLDLNLNYSETKVNGFKPACSAKQKCFPQGEGILNLNDRAFNPSVALSAQVTPWLQPFVSYSHSSRAPNPQEVFFANEGGGSMNPFLKPEKAETYQAGFNIIKNGLLFEQDTFRLKALAYQSRIKNYISSQSFFLCYDGTLCHDIDNSSADFNAYLHTNSLTPVHSDGYEIEASYDVEYAYVNLSWSKQHTDQPTSVASSTQGGMGYGDISDLPDSYATLDIGARFLDKKLVVGSLFKFTGKSKRLSVNGYDYETGQLPKEQLPNIPTIIDLYSNYQLTDNVLLRLSVQNLGNKNYAEALNKLNQDYYYSGDDGKSVNTSARGRTWVFGGEVRF
ncbi:TonB-dependent receptor domain-containing protein [Winslowiella iniecta]|uniref:TonB-dependent receptor domain-containing protein n=1 Tax=Winslowiella iniecta TaxID=1560201 RepID=UPI0009E2FB6D|nr:TonB-dependent receptor [Winslowiella iniecta]